jgi:hypothetical protein
MREFEMRQRIEGFLKRRMQGMLAPALGLGLAVSGCTKEVAIPVYSAPLPDGHAGPIEDAAGLTHDTPVYSAPVPPDGATADAFAAKDTLPMGTDSAPDLGTTADAFAASDLATVADAIVPADLLATADAALGSDAKKDTSGEAGAGVDTGAGVDAGTGADVGVDLGGFGMKYIAQLPDARPDLGMVALYMAQPPSGRS